MFMLVILYFLYREEFQRTSLKVYKCFVAKAGDYKYIFLLKSNLIELELLDFFEVEKLV